MEKSELTVREAISFTRHDFLNELQVVLMHLDLGDVAEARRKILEATGDMRKESQLSRLNMPELETWLLSFSWRYGAFAKQLNTQLATARNGKPADGQKIVEVLDELFQQLEKGADPFSEESVVISVEVEQENWQLTFTLPGQTAPIVWKDVKEADWVAEMSIENEYWMFTIRGQ